jgi:glyoxylase-like metal-dependent hydrolase (beta-lactamase superfamily II)
VHGSWREIGDRVHVGRYRYYDQDIGAIVGSDGVLVVDTRTTPGQAREIVEDVAAVTGLSIRWFVNTHWHYDHAFGNATLRPAEGWGHVACSTGLGIHGERMRRRVARDEPALAGELAEVTIDPPERLFDDSATVDIGAGRSVELRFLGRGHTDADIVVLVPDAGVLFAGDLLENGAPPYFGDAYPIDWPVTVERMVLLVDGAVVPGHGDVADRAFVERQLTDLRGVAELARVALSEGLAVDEVLANAPWGGGPLVREGIERAIAQLEGRLASRSG